MAERINYCRYLSHFRAIHRGAPFVEMRVTTVRRLLPESWGFLCPVHTPDGTPCGLLNHLTSSCVIAAGQTEAMADANTAICAVSSGRRLSLVPCHKFPRFFSFQCSPRICSWVVFSMKIFESIVYQRPFPCPYFASNLISQ